MSTTYRENNIYALLDQDIEGDPEAISTKDTSKKLEPSKVTPQKKTQPAKKQESGIQKQAEKTQPQPQKDQNKKQDNQVNKGAEKQGQRGNNTGGNRNASNNTKPHAAPSITHESTDYMEKPVSGKTHSGHEPLKKERKSRTGFDNDVKKGGGGRHNWGKAGTEYRPRNSGGFRNEKSDHDESTATTEEISEPAKEGEPATSTEGTSDAKPDAPKEPELRSLDEYLKEKEKTKSEFKLPEPRKAGEGEENKWQNFVPLNKKKDDVYIQVSDTGSKKTSSPSTPPSAEKDNKNKKGQVLEINLPSLRKPRENKRGNYNSNSGVKRGSFKKSGSGTSATINITDEKSFPKLQTST